MRNPTTLLRSPRRKDAPEQPNPLTGNRVAGSYHSIVKRVTTGTYVAPGRANTCDDEHQLIPRRPAKE
jgi:hypothetical protein